MSCFIACLLHDILVACNLYVPYDDCFRSIACQIWSPFIYGLDSACVEEEADKNCSVSLDSSVSWINNNKLTSL